MEKAFKKPDKFAQKLGDGTRFHAMGVKTAKIHLGSGTGAKIAEHLTKHRLHLTEAVAKMVEATRQEQEFYSARTG